MGYPSGAEIPDASNYNDTIFVTLCMQFPTRNIMLYLIMLLCDATDEADFNLHVSIEALQVPTPAWLTTA